MKEKSRFDEAFREYPAGVRIQGIHSEYVPELLPEMSLDTVGEDGCAR